MITDKSPPPVSRAPSPLEQASSHEQKISEASKKLDKASFFNQSLTPENVLLQIRRDIISVLGLKVGVNGKFTALEERLIRAFECVVRKAHCPSTLVKQKDLYYVLLCLKKHFRGHSVTIKVNDTRVRVEVFDGLYQYAKEAALCEREIQALRAKMRSASDWKIRDDANKALSGYKKRKYDLLKTFQTIVFTDVSNLHETNSPRVLTLYGKPATLDGLIQFYREGADTDDLSTSGTWPSLDTSFETDPQLDISSTFRGRAVIDWKNLPEIES